MAGINTGILTNAHPLTTEQVNKIEQAVIENKKAFAYLDANSEICFAVPSKQAVDGIKGLACHNAYELFVENDLFTKNIYKKTSLDTFLLTNISQKSSLEAPWQNLNDRVLNAVDGKLPENCLYYSYTNGTLTELPLESDIPVAKAGDMLMVFDEATLSMSAYLLTKTDFLTLAEARDVYKSLYFMSHNNRTLDEHLVEANLTEDKFFEDYMTRLSLDGFPVSLVTKGLTEQTFVSAEGEFYWALMSCYHENPDSTQVCLPFKELFAKPLKGVSLAQVPAYADANMILPNGVTYLDHCAFMECGNLESITLPKTLTFIGRFALSSSPKLTTIIFEGTVAQWQSITKVDGWCYGISDRYIQCSDGQVAIS